MISIKETSRPRLSVPGFSPDQMREIGDFARAEEITRISHGLNINDLPAKPLARWYARRKQKAGGQPVRDLRLTGAMLRAREVTGAETNQAVLSFTDPAQEAKAEANERIEPMFGISPQSKRDLDAHMEEQFAESVRRIK
jgi:hypothetical protein